MSMPAIVRVSHAAAYPDPIKVSARDRLTLTGDIEIWDEHRWFQAVAADCKSGWIPDNFVVVATKLRLLEPIIRPPI
jgi:hypothetical protein